jgi:hypothetical protein
MTKQAQSDSRIDRRAFLKRATAGASGAAIAVATLGQVTPAQAAPKTDDKDGGYRETEHVKRYYELARI